MGWGDWAGAALTGGASIGGKLFGGGSGGGAALLSGIPLVGQGFAQQEQQRFGAEQSAKQMAFQERMSNTKHQRQVTDLKAAGLNPILSANAGGSTPSGSMAQSGAASGAGDSAKLMQSAYEGVKKKNASQADLLDKQGQLATLKAQTEKDVRILTQNSARKAKADALNSEQTNKFMKMDSKRRENDEWMEKYQGQFMRTLNNAKSLSSVFKYNSGKAISQHKKTGGIFRDKTRMPKKQTEFQKSKARAKSLRQNRGKNRNKGPS